MDHAEDAGQQVDLRRVDGDWVVVDLAIGGDEERVAVSPLVDAARGEV